MLKGAILGVLFLPALVVAQQQGPVRVEKPVMCASTEDILPEIYKQYREIPIWGSQIEDSKIALFVNPETKTWSIIQWNDQVACAIEAGTNYFLKFPGSGI